jgi:UDP-N-acetylmuramoyl-L-alanyl-D-glutamate--2,6-diaminopimelate ligase
MLKRIFEAAGYPCASIGTVGCFSVDREIISEPRLTTPDPETLYSTLAKMKQDGAKYVFMEVSSHSLVQGRVEAISFDTAVFTNLSEDHLDFHGDMENYYKAKEILFTKCRRAVINTDDAAGRRLLRFLQGRGVEVKSCSLEKGDLCALFKKTVGTRGSEYALKTESGMYRVFLPLLGDFQIMNSLEAIAVALMYGIPVERIREALRTFVANPGRMEMLRAHAGQDFEIIIDYAHTPDALEKLLRSAKELKDDRGKLILVFGCGGEREREKRRMMGRIATSLADVTLITTDNPRGEKPRAIIDDILKGIDKEKAYAVIEDRRSAIEAAVGYARRGDIVLLAGKGHETYQIDADGKHPFDEREIIREALKKLYER